MSQLRIFLADANRDGRLALQMLLDHQPGMRIVGNRIKTVEADLKTVESELYEAMLHVPATMVELVGSEPEIEAERRRRPGIKSFGGD